MTRGSENFVQTFVHKFAAKTRILATTGIEILRLVENVPHILVEDEKFMKMQVAAQKLLGVSEDDSKLQSKQYTTTNCVIDNNVGMDDAGVGIIRDDVVVSEHLDDGETRVNVADVHVTQGIVCDDGLDGNSRPKRLTNVTSAI
ncbi:aspartyl/glutamyl-tRNA(Asn/Gln) amidotransferasesubunit C, partial [Striga asiatica]